MKVLMFNKIAVVFLVLIAISSCSKNDNEKNAEEPIEILIERYYGEGTEYSKILRQKEAKFNDLYLLEDKVRVMRADSILGNGSPKDLEHVKAKLRKVQEEGEELVIKLDEIDKEFEAVRKQRKKFSE